MSGGVVMAGKELMIDDEYCNSMKTYFVEQGEFIDKRVAEYISILQNIRNNAITSGDVAKALSEYITYASELSKQVGNLSSIAKGHVDNFLSRVDSADQYLF